ncbi:flagellar hook-associated protein FlgK [Luteimonas sp. RD2P54]|uniref:Flagellar hook-associated protein 1 n=1 Tax=Luteimonas endophytica TaxID=3042023 RepID=A0ABT6J7E7_9GAMM|nr:flagellar hook-associated protein FlgK [Luteimonas endophytica]MDH5822752.1 flagellar hook-associated protein FlgK [Luteimonas endophytica]
MSNVLSTGTSALIAFQRALSTVSHNVANINTPGYSRQRVDFATRNPTDYGFGYVGGGTKIADIHRVADSLATSRLLDAGGELARLQQISGLSNRLDSLVSDTATGISGMWSNFFDSVSALSSNAASSAERENLLSQGNALATRFGQLDAEFDRLDREVDAGLQSAVGEINRLSAEIAQLNGKIGSSGGKAAPDLLDRRDLLVSQLVDYTGGTAVSQDGSTVNVVTAGGQALVVGATASRLGTVADPFRPERQQLALETQGQQIRLDERAMGGRVGGLLEFRSSVLDPALAELGRIAIGLGDAFNQAHGAGMDLYGQLGGDFFALPSPTANAHAGNAGSAVLQASLGEVGALDGRDVVLRFDGGGWSATRADTGASVPLTGTGTAADPLRVNGVEIEVGGVPANGDRFLLQPTAGAAGAISVAITDPSRIAAASPVKVSADLANTGTGKPGKPAVGDAAHPDLLTPATIEFIDGDQYTLDGAGPYPYTPGQTISANGWSMTLDGAPAAGDAFTVGPTGAGSSDNGNAALLANLDDARTLNGGTVSLNGAVAGLTTTVGSAARQAEYSADAQQVIHDQALAARDSVSGVNLDEEAADMLRLQQAYQAAAQIISTADTMFQSILNATRR